MKHDPDERLHVAGEKLPEWLLAQEIVPDPATDAKHLTPVPTVTGLGEQATDNDPVPEDEVRLLDEEEEEKEGKETVPVVVCEPSWEMLWMV